MPKQETVDYADTNLNRQIRKGTVRYALLDLDQRYSSLGVDFFLKVSRTLGQNQFARRPDARLNQVSTVRSSVGTPYDYMRVHLRFALLECDVADHREQFYLFIENHCRIIFFCFPVEPAELRIGKRADSFETASGQALFL